jgi:metallo-beta-lactamase family protein
VFANKPGDGSAREQAASCQKVLGGFANICYEFATKRYRSNCINWGILPFTLAEGADFPYETGDYVFVKGIRQAIIDGKEEFAAKVVSKDGSVSDVTLYVKGLTEDEKEVKLVFSGDVGNKNQPLINNPKTIEDADYLLIESTYGNRLHEAKRDNIIPELASYLQRAFDNGGNVIIPSFAVGRTQEMLYAIREIKQNGLVKGHDGFPVYVDSPLASEATAIFMQCNPICFDEETLALINKGINPIWFDGIRITQTSDESKLINENPEPKVIISASGMCEAGRIRHHLKHNLWKKNSIILFVGYQSEGSLGRKLIEGEKTVTLFGEEISVNAEICTLHGTSGHADRDGLFD